jgi:hypothetical protein
VLLSRENKPAGKQQPTQKQQSEAGVSFNVSLTTHLVIRLVWRNSFHLYPAYRIKLYSKAGNH